MKQRAKGMWLVQICEYVIGFALAMSAANSVRPAALAVVAIAIIVNTAISDGSLAAFHILRPRTHRAVGIGIAFSALIIAAVAPLNLTSRLTLAVAALTQGFVSVRFGHGFRTTSTRPH
ncbi:MAG: hypothetical protein EXQ61_02280 [Ilumatobacteraceae bacterium]|nr:hypothetical protein [Ilumatobacteraceae bacterium]